VQALVARKLGPLLFVVMFSAFVLGCTKVTNSSELVGKYEAHHRNGVETLELRADGTYVSEFKSSDGKEMRYSSSLKLGPDGWEPKVFFDNFVQHFPGTQESPIGTLVGIENRGGKIRLYVSYDRDLYYTKTTEK